MWTPNDNLENLVRTGGLKTEPPDRRECEGLFHSACARLKDAHAYNTAHALALTALRLRGCRSDRRYLVFQCLVHTTNTNKGDVRLFALCHDRRNVAEYEGYLQDDEQLLAELIAAADRLRETVQKAMASAT